MNTVEINKCNLRLALLGYTSKLSRKGIRQLAENNHEDVVRYTKDYILFKDGSLVRAIIYSDSIRGYKFDQLILFDDDRWEIKIHSREIIERIIRERMYCSVIPEEWQILYYEDINAKTGELNDLQ